MSNSASPYTDTYLVEGNRGWLLIDTSWDTANSFQALENQIKELGLVFGNISQMVLTHTHIDHYGLAYKVKQLSRATLYFHQAEKALIQQRYADPDGYLIQWSQHLKDNGMPEAELPKLQRPPSQARVSPPPCIFPDSSLQGGETISTGLFDLEVFWTPGHSPGHICLYESTQKVLFSGDHILPVTIPNVSYPQPTENPLGKYLASLNQLAQLEANLVLPAHEHSFNNLQHRIGEIATYRQRRLSVIIQVLKTGPRTPYEIALNIPWLIRSEKDKGTAFADLAIWDKRLALGETTAHLELLRCEGKVQRSTRNNVFLYNTTAN